MLESGGIRSLIIANQVITCETRHFNGGEPFSRRFADLARSEGPPFRVNRHFLKTFLVILGYSKSYTG